VGEGGGGAHITDKCTSSLHCQASIHRYIL